MAASATEVLGVETEGGVRRLVLSRPDTLNAFDAELGPALRDAIADAADDPDVRALLITGAGRAFSSGADLKAGFEPTPEGHPDVHTALTERYHPIITGIRRMPKPVIAAVNGPAVGIGCSLALACDLVLVGESAYFLLAFVNIGLVPDGGSSVFVPQKVGFQRAMEMAMLGERLPAPKALEWGLINRVFPDAEFEASAQELVARLAAGPTRSYAGTKRQLNAWMNRGWQDQLELEAQVQREMAGSEDFVEGVMAFVEKRRPAFRGR